MSDETKSNSSATEIRNELRNDKGLLVLYKNGEQAFCYHLQPVVLPAHGISPPQIKQIPCNNSCPAFQIAQRPDGAAQVNIVCGGVGISHLISPPAEAPAPGGGGTIIKLEK